MDHLQLPQMGGAIQVTIDTEWLKALLVKVTNDHGRGRPCYSCLTGEELDEIVSGMVLDEGVDYKDITITIVRHD